ncbi:MULTISPECIES: NYN domain-containing protein [Nocardioides]|uniref:NYN domain-containing protein n=1 Tax=Nocardioides kribbensis TaxID=305517 RepID=A0ABV1P1M9_9ACTN|nr:MULTISPECIES: NYN domain-containing protein [unclassified Nocardioides]KQP64119.1 nuclease [Nocardioides sp. Leaf285]KQQ43146.1 nuclease [Nocardioides sp. Leaf307]MBJ7529092.1 NYN domain-containing protein [Nocardioides sp.]MCM3516194.1 NYN domain-containing protein [Nocardioides sp. P86]
MTERRTYVLVDGENIDATLGNSLLGRRPTPEERPRWERVTAFAEEQWGQPVTGLFFLNASNGHLPASFVQALLALDYRPVPLAGRADEKVVDIGIQRTLDALLSRDADVMLVSHDSDFAPHVQRLLTGHRRVGLMALREYTSTHLSALDVELYDLEDDVAAFNVPLPRVRIIDLDAFDPETFLR